MNRLSMAILGIVGCMLLMPATAIKADWVENGVPVCTATGMQTVPVIASDGAAGIIVSWFDIINYPGEWDIYAQHVDSMGVLQWTGSGVPICSGEYSVSACEQRIVTDGNGGAIVIWEDYSAEDTVSVYAQRVNALGIVQWATGGVVLSRGLNVVVVSDGAGGAIIAFGRSTETGHDIYEATNRQTGL